MRSVVQVYPGPPFGGRRSGTGGSRSPVRGGVAQSGERLLCKQEVIGSIPFTSTNPRAPGGTIGRRISETCRKAGASRPRRDGATLAVMLYVIVNGKCDAAVAVRCERQSVRAGGDGGGTAAECHVPGSSLRMTVSRSSAEGHLVNALALRGDEGRSTLR